MNKKSLIFILGILLLALIGCSSQNNRNQVETSSSIDDSSSIEADHKLSELNNIFEKNGYTFSYEKTNNYYFDGERVNITLNDKINLQIFMYNSEDDANKYASYISSDGFTYTKEGMTVTTEWNEPPHFYKYNNYIILYLGNDENVISILSNSFGNQIAGD